MIDNRAGGGGRLGTQPAAGSAADGYTQLFSLNTSFTIDRSLFKSLPYDPDKAFAPITIIASTSQLLVTNPSFRARNVRELIALCKAQSGTSELRIIGHWRIAASRHGTIPLNDGHRHRARAV